MSESMGMDDQLIELMSISTQAVFAIRMPDGSLMRVADSPLSLNFENKRPARSKIAADTEVEPA